MTGVGRTAENIDYEILIHLSFFFSSFLGVLFGVGARPGIATLSGRSLSGASEPSWIRLVSRR